MKIYRVHLYDAVEGSQGYEFFSSKVAALRSSKQWQLLEPSSREPDTDLIDVEISKKGILAALNRFAGHPNNG